MDDREIDRLAMVMLELMIDHFKPTGSPLDISTCRNTVRAILAALWRPIEEAPEEDGALIIGYDPTSLPEDRIPGTAVMKRSVSEYLGMDQWNWAHDIEEYAGQDRKPTMFMPYMEPPDQSDG